MESIRSLPWLYEIILFIGILNGILFIVGLLYLVKINRQLRKYRFLSKDGQDKNLEELLLNISEKTQLATQDLNKLEEQFVNNLVKEEKHFQHFGLVRFQAFPNTGGDQSFALAMLDGNGNGFVLSSIFGRDESRVYCKPIENRKSKYVLSKEEQSAIDIALGNISNGN